MLLVIAVVGAVVLARKVKRADWSTTRSWPTTAAAGARPEPEPSRGGRVIAVAEVTPAWYLVLGALLFTSAPSACSCAATRW